MLPLTKYVPPTSEERGTLKKPIGYFMKTYYSGSYFWCFSSVFSFILFLVVRPPPQKNTKLLKKSSIFVLPEWK